MGKNLERNLICKCGSGKKYKKCCINKESLKSKGLDEVIKLHMKQHKARIKQSQKQQGLGREIISSEYQGYRMVAVGARLYYDKKWKTFHDFLMDYVGFAFGKAWTEGAFEKSPEEWHPLAIWRKAAFEDLKAQRKGPGVTTGTMIGATFAYLHLSYNLYLLAHLLPDEKVQQHFVKRLRNHEGFEDVFYETTVAAIFIRAGYKLELENEQDSSSSHCEFTAIAKNGERYSVEAKSRRPHKDNVGIIRQLSKALKKKANHTRVIFIDVNIPNLMAKKDEIFDELNRLESDLKIDGKPAEPAYVFITNHSYTYDLKGLAFERMAFAHGFKISDFKIDSKFSNLREAIQSRDTHKAMFDIIKSMNEHREIPSTFDGEIPEFAFDEETKKNRLLVGQSYMVPTRDGDQEGVLETATVMETERKIYGVYKLKSGQRIICTNPVTDLELEAYKKFPETFFGVEISVNRQTKDALDLYDFLYETYQHSPKEKLMEFLKSHDDQEALSKMSREQLAQLYCERTAIQIASIRQVNKTST